jgi:hypothetical protein
MLHVDQPERWVDAVAATSVHEPSWDAPPVA